MMHRVPGSDERLLAPRESHRLLPVQGLALLPCSSQQDPDTLGQKGPSDSAGGSPGRGIPTAPELHREGIAGK